MWKQFKPNKALITVPLKKLCNNGYGGVAQQYQFGESNREATDQFLYKKTNYEPLSGYKSSLRYHGLLSKNITPFYSFQYKKFSKISEDLRRITSLADKEDSLEEDFAEQLVFYLEKDKIKEFEKVITLFTFYLL